MNDVVKTKKRGKGKFFLYFLFFVIILGAHPAYVYQDEIKCFAENIFKEQAKRVLNANIPDKEVIKTFENDAHGKAVLVVGNEDKYGLRHILAKHTKKYFVNFEDKKEVTLFDDDVTGTDIIYGIKDFYKNCIDVDKYNENPDENIVYVGLAKIKGTQVKCLLVVNKDNKQIVNFYPFNKKAEQEFLEAKELTENQQQEQVSQQDTLDFEQNEPEQDVLEEENKDNENVEEEEVEEEE